MADISMGRIVRRGIAGSFDPRGRDDRVQFWIYFALVFAPLIVVQMIAQVALTFPSIDLQAAMQPGYDARAVNLKAMAAMVDGMITSIYLTMALHVVAALLLLTATARRLHDRGRSGLFALILPLAAAVTGFDQARRTEHMLGMMPKLSAELVAQSGAGSPADIFALIAKMQPEASGVGWAAIVASVAMLVLVVELLRAGTPGPNRFGPQPE
jgi:uncharacterized membrane protein YhaH (DUF805 family)